MEITLRDLEPTDLPVMARVWYDGWHEAHAAIVPPALTAMRTLEDFERRLASRMDRVRVAQTAGVVLGFAIVEEDELYQLFVGTEGRGKGVAQRLTEDALSRVRSSGYTGAWLACSIGNTRAAAFYEKTGWALKGEETIAVETSQAPFDLVVWRYEKLL
jgi:ribosomal protein S18 acetylase RimI-like enzyme